MLAKKTAQMFVADICNISVRSSSSAILRKENGMLAGPVSGQKEREHSPAGEDWCSGSEAEDISDDEGTEWYKKGAQYHPKSSTDSLCFPGPCPHILHTSSNEDCSHKHCLSLTCCVDLQEGTILCELGICTRTASTRSSESWAGVTSPLCGLLKTPRQASQEP